VIVRIEVPEGLVHGSEGALWFGLSGGAHPRFVTAAETMGREVSEWLSWYGGVLEANMRSAGERAQDTRRLEEMRALLHDARAPLGVLKYVTREKGGGDTIVSIRQELDYLEEILQQGSPGKEPPLKAQTCDVVEVLRRVYRRYVADGIGADLTLDVGYRSFYGRFPSLELERVITNLVSNARRHAPQAQSRIGVEEEGEHLCIYVRDNGPGIPAHTLRALSEGSTVGSAVKSGWGVGLRSCLAHVRSFGGEISIVSNEGEGTCVTVTIPRSEAPLEVRMLKVADGGMIRDQLDERLDVCIVDDDSEHGRSLSRLLRGLGLEVGQSDSLDSFLRDFAKRDVSAILCDAHMPDGGAERLLPILAASSKSSRLAVVSGDASEEQLYRLAALGAQGFFTKPVDVDEVVAWVREGRG
jgi:CheY-like chemotaxis protein/anti-sigma regulatory factor (Ser/Thr protein kinase)